MHLITQSIPSPSWSGFSIGPLTIHAYALCLLAGIVFAWWFGSRRFVERGGDVDTFERIVLLTVIGGVFFARVYHVITDNQLYFGPGRNPVSALFIWKGGLGIWGAVGGGALVCWLLARRHGVRFAALADVLAPGVLIAQGIGRLGNWFNQELFGRPTTLPWGLQIDPGFRPAGYEQFATFHPTFLYEMVWNFAGAAVLLLVIERRFVLRQGQLFALYVAIYTLGRFWIEAMRIDPANVVGGFRINSYTSVVVFLGGLLAFWWLGRKGAGADAGVLVAGVRPGPEAEPEPAPVDHEQADGPAPE